MKDVVKATGCSDSHCELIFQGRSLPQFSTLKDCNIKRNNTLFLKESHVVHSSIGNPQVCLISFLKICISHFVE